ncbi:Ig-like domain-containing protein [candidate division TA06 bacterium]|uniref:Ig-like domain-containing protein n=1 Tax=candidate division TA06 bacterium TaxID=2250710 RepID=A0A933IFP3_UNCT6|nr:Ig-like domain-containing protein [candidate division TA06 bacterium]
MKKASSYIFLMATVFQLLSLSCGKKATPVAPPPEGDLTPPVVNSSYPAGDTSGAFVRNHAITMTFSEAMQQSSVQSAFSASNVSGSFYWIGNTFTFVPDTAFAPNDTVFVSITGNALDLADNGLSPVFNKWYLTSDWLDTTAPTVWAHRPLPDSENISIGTDVMAYASETLSEWSTKALTLTDSAGVKVTGNTILGWNASTLQYMPSYNLKYNTRYIVTIDTSLRDLCWNQLAVNYSWSFRTEKDTVKPTVVSVSPAAGDTGITVNTSITVCFSEPMDKASAQAALSLVPAVAFSGYSWQGDTLMTAALAETLSFKKQYRINVDTTARDAAGNRLAAVHSSTFTTLRGLLVLCNTADQIQMYQQTDLKDEGYLGSYSSPRQIRISADDSMAYVLTQNGVEFIQLKNRNNHLGTVNLRQTCYGLALSFDGTKLAVSDTLNKWLYIINTATMLKEDSVQTIANFPKGVCFNQSGSKAAVICWGGVEIYNTASLHNPPTAVGLTALPNGGEELINSTGDVAYAASGKGFAIINLSTATVTYQSPDISTHPFGLAVSPDGAHLALACYDENAVKIYTTTGAYVATVAVGTQPKGLCYSPDGKWLYVSNSGSSNVSVISRSGNTYTLSSAVTVSSGPWGLAVTP